MTILHVNHIDTCHWFSTAGATPHARAEYPFFVDKTLELTAGFIGEFAARSSVIGHIGRSYSVSVSDGIRVRLTIDQIDDPADNISTVRLLVDSLNGANLQSGNIYGSVTVTDVNNCTMTVGRIAGAFTMSGTCGLTSIAGHSIQGLTTLNCSVSELSLSLSTRIGNVEIYPATSQFYAVIDTPYAGEIVIGAPLNMLTVRGCALHNARVLAAVTNDGIIRFENCYLLTIDQEPPVTVNSTAARLILDSCILVAEGSANYSITTVATSQVDVRFYGLTVANRPYNGPPFFPDGMINAVTTGFSYNPLVI